MPLKQNTRRAANQWTENRRKVTVVPYLYRRAHSLKKMDSHVDTKVVFSAPEKLRKICRLTDPYRKPAVAYSKNHNEAPVDCIEAVV